MKQQNKYNNQKANVHNNNVAETKVEEPAKEQVSNLKVDESSEELTPAVIAKLKKEHGKIYKTTIDNQAFVWRRIKRSEYVEAMTSFETKAETESEKNLRIYMRQERIAKSITVWPPNAEKLIEEYAGYATAIADEGILKSGFDIPETEEL